PTVNASTTVSLTAVTDDFDTHTGAGACNLTQGLTYAWTLSAKPATSNAFIRQPTSATPDFVADVANGSYQVQLVVTDSTGLSSAPKVLNVKTTACGTAAPTLTSATANKTL